MDKIGWTEPLDSERGALEIVRIASCRRALWVAAIDGLRQRVDIFRGARGFVGGRNHYDRCAMQGQRQGEGRAPPLHDGEPRRAGVAGGGDQAVHEEGDAGGARAHGTGIELITIMRPALQCGH